MEHIVFFIHIFKFSVLFIPLIIIGIYRKHNDENLKCTLNRIRIFLVILFVYSVTDMMVYYDFSITQINDSIGIIFFDINNVFYYVCITTWLVIQEDILEIPKMRIFKSIYFAFIVAYLTMWVACFLFTEYWVFEKISRFFDAGMLFLLVLSIVRIVVLIKKEQSAKRKESILAILISILVFVENSAYNVLIIDYSWKLYTVCWALISVIIILLVFQKIKHIQIFSEDKSDFNMVFENAKDEYNLTDRELVVLKEIFSGKNNTQIAESLYISESTVKTHIHNLLQKMNAESRVEAVYKVFHKYF